MGFDNPEQKMSKSIAVQRPGHAVMLLDSPKRIKKTIMSSKTDAGCEFRPDQASPGVRNLVGIYQALSEESVDTIVGRYEGRGYGYLKKDLLDLTLNALTPIQERYTDLMSDPTTLDEVLRPSTERAQTIAAATMERVRTAVGIG